MLLRSMTLLFYLMIAPAHAVPMIFVFGIDKVVPGAISITPNTVFTPEIGYGFDLGIAPKAGEDDASITGEGGFYFSVSLPEGNYDIRALLGQTKGTSNTTIKSEARRLMLENFATTQGQQVTREFTVNIRQPEIQGGARVGLKEREKNYLHWDAKLTLEFNGPRPCIAELEIVPAVSPVTVYLLGDSTVADQPYEPWSSWGQMLPRFFKRGVAVANYAESGESLQSSLSAKRVAKVESLVKKGEYVFVQFGHNDMKDKREGALQRYEADLTALVNRVQAKGGIPVLVTSMERKAGINRDTLADYPNTMIRVAKAEKAALIDLHAMSRLLYVGLGEKLDAAFQDGTHHNNFGSYEIAKCVVEGIRNAKLPLATMLTADVKTFDPAHPDSPADFHYAASPLMDLTKPDGN